MVSNKKKVTFDNHPKSSLASADTLSSTSSSSNARPLQPSNIKPSADGQVKVRLMPATGITFTHPVISIQSPTQLWGTIWSETKGATIRKDHALN